jgi:predicted RecB family nuclease
MAYRLSTSSLVNGWKCPNLLWWQVHDRDAVELVPGVALRGRLEQGQAVGKLAQERVPGGVLIDLPHTAVDERIAATQEAIDGGVPAVYEASFLADDVFVIVDIIERVNGGFNLIDVKASTRLKEEHLPDAAIQTHVVTKSGLDLHSSQVMHLNKECRYPDLSNLFTRRDVTEKIKPLLSSVPDQIAQQLDLINGPEPEIAIGEQCFGAHECPFRGRCWPDMSGDHVGSLAGVGLKKTWELMQQGFHSIHDLPADVKIPKAAQRQKRAVLNNEMIVGPKLGDAMAQFESPLAFLDFETISCAIPVWRGCRPWQQAAVQFSCHVQTEPGVYVHHEFLAEPGRDPREKLALALINACRDARSVVAYWASFERDRITELSEALPHLAGGLNEINARLVDLHTVVKDHVYHPDFHGSFSIKDVLPALVPELTYDSLEIPDGETASYELARLLLKPETLSVHDTKTLRSDLLDYCELDTWAMVKLLERLRELAGKGTGRDGRRR